jgi:hypothetical protein
MTDNNLEYSGEINRDPLVIDAFKIIGKKKDSFIESYVARELVSTEESQFFIIIEILNLEVDADDIADSLVETFRKHYYEDSTLDPYARFEEALKFVNDVARDIQSNGVPLFQINMSISALIGNILYLSQANDAEIYLLRGGIVSNISEGLAVSKRKEHSDLFENIATGVLEKNDTVLFSSSRLIRYITQVDLGRMFHFKNIDDGLDLLEDAVQNDVLGRVGVLGFKVMNNLIEELPDSDVSVDLKSADFKLKFKFVMGKLKYYGKQSLESFDEFKAFFLKFVSGKKTRTDNLKHAKAVKVLAGAFICLFVIFVLSAAGVLDSPSKKANLELLEQARSVIAAAKSEVDRERSAQLIFNASEKLDKVMTTKSLRSEAEDLLAELNQVKSIVDNMIVLDELTVYADISEKRSDASLIGMLKLLNKYYAYDGKRLYEFIGDLVKDPVNLYDQGTIVKGASFSDTESLVFLTSDNRIREYESGIVKFMDTEDQDYKPATQVLAYGSRLYFFDNQMGQVWKYQRKRDSYAKAEPSLSNIDNKKVKTAKDFAIDGSVYLLYETGDIEKYYNGSKVMEFGFDTKQVSLISQADVIYTESDFPYILVMESSQKKIYQYYKDPKTGNLKYLRQYYFEGLNELTGFIADLTNKRLLVSDTNKVYSTSLLN